MFPVFSLSGRSISLSGVGSPYTASRSSGGSATISFTTNTDGTIAITGTVFSTVNLFWAGKSTPGIGASYWVKYTETITLNNGSGGGSSSGSTGVLALTSNRAYTLTSDTVTNTITATLQIDIYADSGGTQRVATTTTSLSAVRT